MQGCGYVGGAAGGYTIQHSHLIRARDDLSFFLPTQLGLCFLPVDLLRVVAHADLQADLGDR